MSKNPLEQAQLFGEELLQLPIGDASFLERVDAYLLLVEEVEQFLKSGGKTERAEAEGFMKVHGQVIGRAQLEKQEVLQSLSELHRRSSVLRSYIDQGPERVSITGKREG